MVEATTIVIIVNNIARGNNKNNNDNQQISHAMVTDVVTNKTVKLMLPVETKKQKTMEGNIGY
jgi:hypothetical protein